MSTWNVMAVNPGHNGAVARGGIFHSGDPLPDGGAQRGAVAGDRFGKPQQR